MLIVDAEWKFGCISSIHVGICVGNTFFFLDVYEFSFCTMQYLGLFKFVFLH